MPILYIDGIPFEAREITIIDKIVEPQPRPSPPLTLEAHLQIDGVLRLKAELDHKRSLKNQLKELEQQRFQQEALRILQKRKNRFSRWWKHII